MVEAIDEKEKLRLQLSDMIANLENHLRITQPGQTTRNNLRQAMLRDVFYGEYESMRVMGQIFDDEDRIYRQNLI